MRRFQILIATAIFSSLFLLNSPLALADVGVVIYESKGVDARRTDTGHIALISTILCAEGIDRLRACRPGEPAGVVITRYANLASNYTKTVFVTPILDHFSATGDPGLVPALSSGGTLESMQIEYWRRHLRTYFPPLSQKEYQAMKAQSEKFDGARLVRQVMTFEFLGTVLGSHKKHYPTEPFAIIDPATRELIPNGRWREAVGVQHMRNAVIVTAAATPVQEMALIDYIHGPDVQPFQVLTNNCSDFVKYGLMAVYADSGLRFRPRSLQVADAWITSPISVATDFLNFVKREKLPIAVTAAPMFAGTRRVSAPITSISRGALIPNTSQGKIAFALKVYINTLNPLLGLTSFAVDGVSRFADLQELVHQRGGGDLSSIENRIVLDPQSSPETRKTLRREQNRVFGASSCWSAKREQFATLAAQAAEFGVLTPAEDKLLLKRSRPFLLPRLYESNAAARHSGGILMAGMQDCLPPDTHDASPGCGTSEPVRAVPLLSSRAEAGFVPGRAEIQAMAQSNDRMRQITAFKLIASVINYDLSVEPASRRISERFDPDWQLLLNVAEKNGLRVGSNGGVRESIGECSCREFDAGQSKIDSLGEERRPLQRLARQGRELLHGPTR
ncbi:MAG: hypothetical protein M3Z23_11530 [Acidobacteriota bacterium]|nr:hypothetical protein [Acidobacteriota bacterium]